MTGRELSIFACVADTLLAPAPPLPPVRETDAAAAFDAWMARAPRLNRTAIRALLLALEIAPRLMGRGARWRRLPAPERLAVVRRLDRAGARPAVEALRACAASCYYGDARVSALLGYVPAAR